MPDGLAAGGVQHPDRATGALGDLQLAVAQHVGQRWAARGAAVQGLCPPQVATRVDGDQLVGVGGTGVVVAEAGHDAVGRAGIEELPDRGRGLHHLVGLVLAGEPAVGLALAGVAGRAQYPQLAAVVVLRVVGESAARVVPLDDVGLAVAVDVGEGRRGESCCRPGTTESRRAPSPRLRPWRTCSRPVSRPPRRSRPGGCRRRETP